MRCQCPCSFWICWVILAVRLNRSLLGWQTDIFSGKRSDLRNFCGDGYNYRCLYFKMLDVPGTQMGPLVLIGISALFWGGRPSKIEVIWVPGITSENCRAVMCDWRQLKRYFHVPSLKLTVKVPENRPFAPKRKGSSRNHPFSGGKMLVSGILMIFDVPKNIWFQISDSTKWIWEN